jgi:hypothetical protein
MSGLLITSSRKTDLQLFTALAKRLGVKVRSMTDEELLDIGLLKAMEEGRDSSVVPAQKIINKLKGNGD